MRGGGERGENWVGWGKRGFVLEMGGGGEEGGRSIREMGEIPFSLLVPIAGMLLSLSTAEKRGVPLCAIKLAYEFKV